MGFVNAPAGHRTMWGTINAVGGIDIAGSGDFTVTHPGTGQYVITPNPTTAVLFGGVGSSENQVVIVSMIPQPGPSTTLLVMTWDTNALALSNAAFSFMATIV